MPGIMLLFLLSMPRASAGQAQRVWEITCEDGSTHAGPSIDAILENRPSDDKCTVEVRGGPQRSLPKASMKPALRLPWPGADTCADTCDLCAKEWVFIFSTGRAGSTSIMEALNALPNVKISGENQASLEAAAELLGRHLEHIDREMVVQDASTNAAMAHGNINKQVLLCNLQRWFIELSGVTSEAHRQTRAREQNTAPYPCPDPPPSNALLPTLKPSPLPATHPQASRSALRSSLPCKLRARCTTTTTAPRPRDICPWNWATNRAGFVSWTLSFPVPA